MDLTKAEAELIQEMGEFINHANTKKVLVQVEFKKAWIKRIEELLKKLSFLLGNVDAGLGSRQKTSEKTDGLSIKELKKLFKLLGKLLGENKKITESDVNDLLDLRSRIKDMTKEAWLK